MINHDFTIRVITHYVEEQSEPIQSRYVFSYTITIENNGDMTAKLLRRRWLITNSDGKKLVIEGEGVVGEQPLIEPDEEFTYTSGTMLETELGVMEGSYTMQTEDGETFELPIKPFRLSIPNLLH